MKLKKGLVAGRYQGTAEPCLFGKTRELGFATLGDAQVSPVSGGIGSLGRFPGALRSTVIAAVFYVLPTPLPLLAPGKIATADDAFFLWQVGFFVNHGAR